MHLMVYKFWCNLVYRVLHHVNCNYFDCNYVFKRKNMNQINNLRARQKTSFVSRKIIQLHLCLLEMSEAKRCHLRKQTFDKLKVRGKHYFSLKQMMWCELERCKGQSAAVYIPFQFIECRCIFARCQSVKSLWSFWKSHGRKENNVQIRRRLQWHFPMSWMNEHFILQSQHKHTLCLPHLAVRCVQNIQFFSVCVCETSYIH